MTWRWTITYVCGGVGVNTLLVSGHGICMGGFWAKHVYGTRAVAPTEAQSLAGYYNSVIIARGLATNQSPEPGT
jgi:hypothetical protein